MIKNYKTSDNAEVKAKKVSQNKETLAYIPTSQKKRWPIKITCSECKTVFEFTEQDYKFYRKNHYTQLPKRCKSCRKKNKGGYVAGKPKGVTTSTVYENTELYGPGVDVNKVHEE